MGDNWKFDELADAQRLLLWVYNSELDDVFVSDADFFDSIKEYLIKHKLIREDE